MVSQGKPTFRKNNSYKLKEFRIMRNSFVFLEVFYLSLFPISLFEILLNAKFTLILNFYFLILNFSFLHYFP